MSDSPPPKPQPDRIVAIIADLERLRKIDAERAEILARLPTGIAESVGLVESSQLPKFVHSATMDDTMQASKDEIAPKRGAKIEFPRRPMAIARKNSGLSILEISKALDIPYSTAKSWGAKSLPPDEVRAKLAKSPYLVPLNAWKLS